MLKFARSKLVSVYRKDENTLLLHGILDDDIYGIEMDVKMEIPSLKITSIAGKWVRQENGECQRALPFLQEAVGFRVDENFPRKVQKTLGRKACPQFANLLIECGNAAGDAVSVINVPSVFAAPVLPDYPDTNTEGAGQRKSEKHRRMGTIIDLHAHSLEASPCSSAPVDELIREAKRIGLDGICLTDHNHIWETTRVKALRQKNDFLVLRGSEITTDQGDMVVFGLEKDIKGIIKLEDLKKEVLKTGGFIIVAHPFRGFLTFGMGQLGLTVEKAMERPLFKFVDAVEVLNSKVTAEENGFASKVAAGLGLPATGGSDAHEVSGVGIYATQFSDIIRNEEDLIEALKKGDYSPVAFRQKRGDRER